MFSIPATTGVEFGLGKDAVNVTGSERNEDWTFDDGESFDHVESEEGDPVPVGNDHGGLQGGITTGEPIYGEATWHAPTSIPKSSAPPTGRRARRRTCRSSAGTTPSSRRGAVPVVEAMLYCTVLDFMLLAGRINPDRVDGNPGQYDTDYHPSSPDND